MNELSKKVIELEKEYFNLIYELFNELILIYSEDNISIDEAVKKFLAKQQHATIFIPGYKDNYSFKRKQMYKMNQAFWEKNKDTVVEFIIKEGNVGIFGVGDNTFTSEYLNEIKRNSLFYDVLVFNDPFYTFWSSDKELDFDSNVFLFYRNILYIWEIKRYLSVEENEVFTIIFPFDSLLTHEDSIIIMDESHAAAVSWINQIFDITNDKDDIVSNIEKIKNLSKEKIQEELYRNGIYESYLEALNYSQNLLTEDVKKEIEKFCFEAWGNFNRDFVRCILTLEALPAMATVNYYTYKLHSLLSMRLKSNPIMSRNEWVPMQRELKNQSLKVSGDYMYTCAIHRNDQMATLMELDYDEIVRYHNKKQCTDFRNLFYRATNEIVNTHVNVDEIANEVFFKTDELLMKEYNNIFANKKKTRKNAIIGFIKGAIGFVPVLSYAVSAFDMAISTTDFVRTLNNKELPDVNKKDGMSEIIFHSEAVPRINMMIQKLKSGRIATFDDYLKGGDEKKLDKIMKFLEGQKKGNAHVHTEEAARANVAMDSLIEKVGMFAMEKQNVSVDSVKENFSIGSQQAEDVIKQLETMGVLDKKDEMGNHKVLMDKDAFSHRIRGYQDLAERMRAISKSKDMNLADVTISKTLIAKESETAVKTRIPGTWGDKARYIWIHKDNIMDIHSGKTMLTFLDRSKEYKIYDAENRVVETKKGEELYAQHYDKVEAEVRERYEKTQRRTKAASKAKAAMPPAGRKR